MAKDLNGQFQETHEPQNGQSQRDPHLDIIKWLKILTQKKNLHNSHRKTTKTTSNTEGTRISISMAFFRRNYGGQEEVEQDL